MLVYAAEHIAGDPFEFIGVERAEEAAENGVIEFQYRSGDAPEVS